jgi:hypothetical protein
MAGYSEQAGPDDEETGDRHGDFFIAPPLNNQFRYIFRFIGYAHKKRRIPTRQHASSYAFTSSALKTAEGRKTLLNKLESSILLRNPYLFALPLFVKLFLKSSGGFIDAIKLVSRTIMKLERQYRAGVPNCREQALA